MIRIAGPSEAVQRLRLLASDRGAVRAVAFLAGPVETKASIIAAWSRGASAGDRLVCWPRRRLTAEETGRLLARLRLTGMTAALVEVRTSDTPAELTGLAGTAVRLSLPLILMDRDPGPLFAGLNAGRVTA